MEHSDRIIQIIEGRGLTTYRVAKETGITNSLFSLWRKKPTSKIYSGNLVLIADYLGCSVDYLLGRTEDPELHHAPETSAVESLTGLLAGKVPEDYDARALKEERLDRYK